jgi:deoxyribonuclease-4
MKINFGLKLWSVNTELIRPAIQLIDEKVFDYIELFIIPGTLISPFKIDIPFIIHIPHGKFGVNIGDPEKKKYNIKKINESINWADELNAKYLILHVEHGSIEHAKDLLQQITDSRLLIENMPKVGLNNEQMIGYSPVQIRELIGVGDIGFCLDLNHAVKAAISLKVNYKDYVNKMLLIKPEMFHISDGKLTEEKDEHLSIGQGEYDFGFLLNCIMKNDSNLVTLETPRLNKRSLDEDIQNCNKLKSP